MPGLMTRLNFSTPGRSDVERLVRIVVAFTVRHMAVIMYEPGATADIESP